MAYERMIDMPTYLKKFACTEWLKLSLWLVITLQLSCASSKSFWRYIVEDEVEKPVRPKGEVDLPRVMSPHNVKVVFNDGSASTEVLIPVLATGQQIVIDHRTLNAPRSVSLTPLPPVPADKDLEESYLKAGHSIDTKKSPVSIVKTHEKIRQLVKEGNDAVALEYVEQLLARYPNHVKTLRTKGSLLLKMGEREAAIKAYLKAQEIEPDPRVEEQIQATQKSLDGQNP